MKAKTKKHYFSSQILAHWCDYDFLTQRCYTKYH